MPENRRGERFGEKFEDVRALGKVIYRADVRVRKWRLGNTTSNFTR
jgi:hypothetical protein